jgi:hypothetical protein
VPVREPDNILNNPDGERLTVADLRDFDMCWAFDLIDPWS